MKIIAGGVTDKGQVRVKNQDRITFHIKNDKKNILSVACICDGIGSFDNSEMASEIVIQKIDAWLEWVWRQYKGGMTGPEIVEELENTVHEANEAVYLYSKEKQVQIGCTMSVILVMNKSFCIFHVGDSRICCLRKGRLTQITHDEVSYCEENGRVKSRLTNYMGKSMELWLSRLKGDVQEEDIFILGSDGLFHKLEEQDFVILTRKVKNDKQMQKVCENTLKLAVQRGERDNISCVMLQLKK